MQASSSRPTVSPPPPPTKSPVKACAKSGPSKAVGETLAVGNTDLVDLFSTLNSVKTSQDALIVGIQQHEQAPTATHNAATAPLVSRSTSSSATVSLPQLKELKTEMDHLKEHIAQLTPESADACSVQQLKQEVAQWRTEVATSSSIQQNLINSIYQDQNRTITHLKESLQETRVELSSAIDMATERQSEVERLQADLSVASSMAVNAELAGEQQTLLEEMEAALTAAQEESAGLRGQLEEAERELMQRADVVTAMREEVDSLRAAVPSDERSMQALMEWRADNATNGADHPVALQSDLENVVMEPAVGAAHVNTDHERFVEFHGEEAGREFSEHALRLISRLRPEARNRREAPRFVGGRR